MYTPWHDRLKESNTLKFLQTDDIFVTAWRKRPSGNFAQRYWLDVNSQLGPSSTAKSIFLGLWNAVANSGNCWLCGVDSPPVHHMANIISLDNNSLIFSTPNKKTKHLWYKME